MTRLAIALASLRLRPEAEESLNNFTRLFLRWNRSINLSAARCEDDLHDHIIDSLHIVPHLGSAGRSPAPASIRVLDVGAGGGLPGVIAAICLADAHITALEPVHKKHAFLRTAARELALVNFDPCAERLEDHQRHDYDAAMSRATFDLREWLDRGLTHVRPGGLVLGFEAVLRPDLPQRGQRDSYALGDKARSIVALRSPA